MRKVPAKILFPIFYFLVSVPPALAQVFDIWRGTGEGGTTAGGRTCNVLGPCTFCDGLIVASNVITLLFQIAIPVAIGVIVWCAIKMMLAGGSSEKVSSARKIMTSAVIGIIIVFAAVVILKTIFHVLSGSPDFPWESISCDA